MFGSGRGNKKDIMTLTEALRGESEQKKRGKTRQQANGDVVQCDAN